MLVGPFRRTRHDYFILPVHIALPPHQNGIALSTLNTNISHNRFVFVQKWFFARERKALKYTHTHIKEKRCWSIHTKKSLRECNDWLCHGPEHSFELIELKIANRIARWIFIVFWHNDVVGFHAEPVPVSTHFWFDHLYVHDSIVWDHIAVRGEKIFEGVIECSDRSFTCACKGKCEDIVSTASDSTSSNRKMKVREVEIVKEMDLKWSKGFLVTDSNTFEKPILSFRRF